jgi:hypothetical protein
MSRRKFMAHRAPCGRASRAGLTELLPPTEIRPLFDAAMTGLRDPLFGTMLGRIHLAGKISRAEFAAGKRWAELTTEYNVSCQGPRPPQTVALDHAGGTSADPDSSTGRREVKRHARASAAYANGKHALRQAGFAAELAVEEVCINEGAPAGFEQLQALQVGLRALSEFWLSSAKRKAGIR